MSAASIQIKKDLSDAIQRRLKEDHISINAFAKRLKTGRNVIRRLLDSNNTAITLKTMCKAADALNLQLSITMKRLPLSEIDALFAKVGETNDEHQAALLEKQILEGYYGKPIEQLDAEDPTLRTTPTSIAASH